MSAGHSVDTGKHRPTWSFSVSAVPTWVPWDYAMTWLTLSDRPPFLCLSVLHPQGL